MRFFQTQIKRLNTTNTVTLPLIRVPVRDMGALEASAEALTLTLEIYSAAFSAVAVAVKDETALKGEMTLRLTSRLILRKLFSAVKRI